MQEPASNVEERVHEARERDTGYQTSHPRSMLFAVVYQDLEQHTYVWGAGISNQAVEKRE